MTGKLVVYLDAEEIKKADFMRDNELLELMRIDRHFKHSVAPGMI